MCKVSIIITCYNYGFYLHESICSALEQNVDNFEIIIINDGSTDNTGQIIQTYLSDPRIIYIKQENQGQPKAKNRGISESHGDYLAFLDADDIWLPTKMEKQLDLFSDHDVAVVYTRRQWMDPQGDFVPGNERTLRRGKILDQIIVDNFICFSSSMVRRSALDQVGWFDEELPMGIDYDLWIRLAARYKFDYVDEPLVRYRTGHANLSKNVMRRYECAQKIMRKALADQFIASQLSWYVPRLAWTDTWSNMASYYGRQGMHAQALKFFAKSVAQFPVYMPLWKRLAKYLLRK